VKWRRNDDDGLEDKKRVRHTGKIETVHLGWVIEENIQKEESKEKEEEIITWVSVQGCKHIGTEISWKSEDSAG
jgi:hypothetical protein